MASSSIFTKLPEVLIKSVLEFAPQEGPFRLDYDVKKECFIRKCNPYFELLNKANQFKIDNPPVWDVEDPNFDEEIDTTTLDILESLTFVYPLKLRIRKGCERDRWYIDKEKHLILTYTYSKSFYGYITTKCTVGLPSYYHMLNTKACTHYKRQLKKNITESQRYRLRNLLNGFTAPFAPFDQEFN